MGYGSSGTNVSQPPAKETQHGERDG